MLNHPLTIGMAGNIGILAVQPITQANPDLTIILQIIVSLATLLKLFMDYQKKNTKTKSE